MRGDLNARKPTQYILNSVNSHFTRSLFVWKRTARPLMRFECVLRQRWPRRCPWMDATQSGRWPILVLLEAAQVLASGCLSDVRSQISARLDESSSLSDTIHQNLRFRMIKYLWNSQFYPHTSTYFQTDLSFAYFETLKLKPSLTHNKTKHPFQGL